MRGIFWAIFGFGIRVSFGFDGYLEHYGQYHILLGRIVRLSHRGIRGKEV